VGDGHETSWLNALSCTHPSHWEAAYAIDLRDRCPATCDPSQPSTVDPRLCDAQCNSLPLVYHHAALDAHGLLHADGMYKFPGTVERSDSRTMMIASQSTPTMEGVPADVVPVESDSLVDPIRSCPAARGCPLTTVGPAFDYVDQYVAVDGSGSHLLDENGHDIQVSCRTPGRCATTVVQRRRWDQQSQQYFDEYGPLVFDSNVIVDPVDPALVEIWRQSTIRIWASCNLTWDELSEERKVLETDPGLTQPEPCFDADGMPVLVYARIPSCNSVATLTITGAQTGFNQTISSACIPIAFSPEGGISPDGGTGLPDGGTGSPDAGTVVMGWINARYQRPAPTFPVPAIFISHCGATSSVPAGTTASQALGDCGDPG
jgi:hypothetical protein